jgi:prevent-host-death family protein
MVMMVAGVAELKAKLSEYLARVRAGEEVVITDHGKPVAKLVPTMGADERLVELERQGLVRIGTGKLPEGFWDAPRPDLGGSAVEALIEERREGR